MLALLRVLFAWLARLFSGAAQAMNRWATASAAPSIVPVPAPPPLPPGASAVAVPEDWMRRAVPPPPAHWLAVVRARAPHFVPADPRPPRDGDPVRHLLPRLLSRSAADPAPVPPERRPAAASVRFDPTRTIRLLPVPRKPAASRRVVTVVEEQSPRPKRQGDVLPAGVPRTPASVVEEVTDVVAPAPEAPIFPELLSSPLEVAIPSPFAGHSATAVQRTPVKAESFRRLKGTAPVEAVVPDPAGERWSSLPSLRSEASRIAETTGPASAAIRPDWPSLPEPRAEQAGAVCRRLLQEAQMRDELDREQKGLPWNA